MTNSFELDIGEKSRIGSRFMGRVREVLQEAFFFEKEQTKLTQQTIAKRLGVNRSVVNRQLIGLENMTARSIAELLWAMGWEPILDARKIVAEGGRNDTGGITYPDSTQAGSSTLSFPLNFQDSPAVTASST
jgi:hypothetical protein